MPPAPSTATRSATRRRAKLAARAAVRHAPAHPAAGVPAHDIPAHDITSPSGLVIGDVIRSSYPGFHAVIYLPGYHRDGKHNSPPNTSPHMLAQDVASLAQGHGTTANAAVLDAIESTRRKLILAAKALTMRAAQVGVAFAPITADELATVGDHG